MADNSDYGRWASTAPYILAVTRMIAAVLFMLAGAVKLFGFPMGMPPDNSTAVWWTQVWYGGVLELFGGFLLTVGWLTRPVAFILSGEMAVAYFQFHAQQGFWPVMNGGIPAILYCFLWLYYSAAGAGRWSIDGMLANRGRRAMAVQL
jgi:putative oxidoreductase